MKQIHSTSKDGTCQFVPILIDIIAINSEGKDTPSTLFLIMEKEETDLRVLMNHANDVLISDY
jgi:hypothetical protein